MDLLRSKQRLDVETAGQCEIAELLGGGGQGEVYRVSFERKDWAVKWYFPQCATSTQHSALSQLIRIGAPTERFLWPVALVSSNAATGFGYLMPLRSERFHGLVAYLRRRIEPTFYALCTAGIQLADSYLQLHTRGLCYKDINYNNVFFDPDLGDILVCDNDNVRVNKDKTGNDFGTLGFMAPELTLGQVRPSIQTDLFSLSVLLFYLFMMHHPLEGKRETSLHCLDYPAKLELYGRKPLFIFDPHDRSNEPDPKYHSLVLAMWRIYPGFLRDQFIHAFTDGIRDPEHGRVRESEWRADIARLRDSIVHCQICGQENFYDEAHKPLSCWSGCGTQISLPFQLQIGRQVVMLNAERKLFPHHLEGVAYDFSKPVAEVSRHPTDKARWGLKNLAASKWVAISSNGVSHDVAPGKTVELKTGTQIHFGKIHGEIGNPNES